MSTTMCSYRGGGGQLEYPHYCRGHGSRVGHWRGIAMRFPDPQRSRVILIGTSSYRDEALPDLPEINRNVTDMATTLTDPAAGVVLSDNCAVLADKTDLTMIGRELVRASTGSRGLAPRLLRGARGPSADVVMIFTLRCRTPSGLIRPSTR